MNQRHFDRVTRLIDEKKVVLGGQTDQEDLYIAPTVMTGVTAEDACMQEEIFGPLLPIIDVQDEDEAVDRINAGEKPLALYCFTNSGATKRKFVEKTSSGGCCINDVISHVTLNTLPFGGVGNSGMGGYHGWYSFDCFSHKKSVMVKKLSMEPTLSIRYPPYNDQKLKYARMLLGKTLKKPWSWPFLGFVTSMAVLAVAFFFL